jgi:deoxycytidine triphosphate deaminase
MADGGARVSAPAFADSDKEARERFMRFKSTDPFPEISPALLNSADIYDYVRVTGMIYPFREEDLLKPACYQVRLGSWIEYDEITNKMHERVLGEGDHALLKPNGIAFAMLEPTFRVPDYLALRFNLQIVHVHRGLLVGTGPLVDPGFDGRLLLPVHNLTDRQYAFRGGEELVWFEFTKLSPIPDWQERASRQGEKQPRVGRYKPFPASKNIDDPMKYILRAQPSGVIRSSIPVATEEARRSATKAQRSAFRLSLAGGVGVVALILAFTSLVQNDRALVHELQNDRQSLTAQVAELEQRVRSLEQALSSLSLEPGSRPSPSSSPSP